MSPEQQQCPPLLLLAGISVRLLSKVAPGFLSDLKAGLSKEVLGFMGEPLGAEIHHVGSKKELSFMVQESALHGTEAVGDDPHDCGTQCWQQQSDGVTAGLGQILGAVGVQICMTI